MQRQAASTIAPSRRIQQQNIDRVDIPDNDPNGVSSFITVEESGTVRDIQISVAIDHSFLGDLEITLISPTGRFCFCKAERWDEKTACNSPTPCKPPQFSGECSIKLLKETGSFKWLTTRRAILEHLKVGS